MQAVAAAGPEVGRPDAGEVTSRIVGCMREEVLTWRMIDVALRAAVGATGADGAAIASAADEEPFVRHETCAPPPQLLALARLALARAGEAGRIVDDGLTWLAAPLDNRLGRPSMMVLWRAVGPWRAEDRVLASSLTGAMRSVLEQDELLHEMSRHARTDPLTGLLNRRAFRDELDRRVARVHQVAERHANCERGVLLYLDLDDFKPVNKRCGHEVGDAVLVAVAGLLQATFRPTDLLARLGGDQFAVWLDGADELTAAERAEELRTTLPAAAAAVLPDAAGSITASMGIAPADPAGTETDLLQSRADCAMAAAKNAGRNGWQVAHAGPLA